MAVEIQFRTATQADVPAITECHLSRGGPPDARMAAYFSGAHHPYCALPPRTGFVATANGVVVAYIAGHLSTRFGCHGEVQYLFVATEFRRQGIATELLRSMAAWFGQRGATKICVNVDGDSPPAEPFYRAAGAVPLSSDKPLWYVWHKIGDLLTSA